MARLVNPAAGTVVSVGGDLEALYRSRGWLDADAVEPEPEPVKRKPGRPKKSESAE